MEKKIIAIVSVVILLASVLTACGKVKTITLKEGQEYPLATDKEGNTIVNDDGNLVVYVTDENGKYVKDENGERQTNAVTFPEIIVNGSTLETSDYIMTFPKGWEIDDEGVARKKGKEKTFFIISNLGALQNGKSFDAYFDENKPTTEIIEKIKEKNPSSTVSVESAVLTSKKLDCRICKTKIVNEEESVTVYTNVFYFMFNNELYKIESSSQDGGYDDKFDINSFIDKNLTMKG